MTVDYVRRVYEPPRLQGFRTIAVTALAVSERTAKSKRRGGPIRQAGWLARWKRYRRRLSPSPATKMGEELGWRQPVLNGFLWLPTTLIEVG
jgi:hypothetical protein